MYRLSIPSPFFSSTLATDEFARARARDKRKERNTGLSLQQLFLPLFPKVDSELSQYTSLGSHDLYTTYKTDKIRSLFLIMMHNR